MPDVLKYLILNLNIKTTIKILNKLQKIQNIASFFS